MFWAIQTGCYPLPHYIYAFRVQILWISLSTLLVMIWCIAALPSSSSNVPSSRLSRIHSHITRRRRFGLSYIYSVLVSGSLNTLTHFDVRSMSFKRRVASRRSTTTWVNFGSSKSTILPPFPTIWEESSSKLSSMRSEERISTREVWVVLPCDSGLMLRLCSHVILASIVGSIQIEAPNRLWDETDNKGRKAYKCVKIRFSSYSIALSFSPIRTSSGTTGFECWARSDAAGMHDIATHLQHLRVG